MSKVLPFQRFLPISKIDHCFIPQEIYDANGCRCFGLINVLTKIAGICVILLLGACGGGSNNNQDLSNQPSGVRLSVNPSANNVIPVSVGSFPSGNISNEAFVSVTVCVPGTLTCQTIDHVQLDSGSTGLQLVSKDTGGELDPKIVPLPHAQHNGKNIYDCTSYTSQTNAGGLYFADVYINSTHFARNVTVSVAGDSEQHFNKICSSNKNAIMPNGDYVINAPPGDVNGDANGILGVSEYPLFQNDNTAQSCDNNFNCSSYAWNDGFTGPQNVFSMLNSDGNGYTLSLPVPQPAVQLPSDAPTNIQGSLTLGINTQNNNNVNLNNVIYMQKGLVNWPALEGFLGQLSMSSIIGIDTGSSVIYIGSSLLKFINGVSYDASSNFLLLANNNTINLPIKGQDGHNQSFNMTVSITDARAVFSNYPGYAYPGLGSSNGNFTYDSDIILGIPFFFGKNITFGFDGAVIPNTNIVGPIISIH